MVRAWRGLDRFDGRSSLQSWLYRIATNVCLDTLNGRKRRALPVDMAEPSPPLESLLGEPRPGGSWVEPVPDERISSDGDPADVAVARDTVRLAFVAALQHLPPKQRAVLILREVLRWRAEEVAELLDTTVASVNSALQRARATMASRDVGARAIDPMDDDQRDLLARYVGAFESYDMTSLVALLHEDATQNMPPYEMWLQGREDIVAWMVGPGAGCRGSRLLPTTANGCPAFGQYRPSGPGGRHEPWGVHVLEIIDGRVARLTVFLDTSLFPLFGLPLDLED
jgi:RNA polymerase sigma-70 factor, ECF subfamily